MATECGTLENVDATWKALFASRLDCWLDELAESASDLARTLGTSRSWLSNWRGGRPPDGLERFASFCRASGASADYLLGLSDDPNPQRPTFVLASDTMADDLFAPTAPPIVTIAGTRFVPVARLRDPVSAGLPVLSSGLLDGFHLFREDFLIRVTTGPLRPGRVVSLPVHAGWLGESMVPTIMPGSDLLVDRDVTQLAPGQLYIVRLPDGAITCKRVWKTGDSLNCHADNRRHPPLVLPIDRPIPELLPARVVWVANPLE